MNKGNKMREGRRTVFRLVWKWKLPAARARTSDDQ